MKALTDSESQAWCEQRNLKLVNHGIVDAKRSCVLRVPETTTRLLNLIPELIPEAEPFRGGLFWVMDTGSQSDDCIDIGITIHGLMRKGGGLAPLTGAANGKPPACLFDEGELREARAFLAQLLLFSWGGYFVPDDPLYYFSVNPDGVLEVVTDDQQWIDIFSLLPEYVGIRQDGRWIVRADS